MPPQNQPADDVLKLLSDLPRPAAGTQGIPVPEPSEASQQPAQQPAPSGPPPVYQPDSFNTASDTGSGLATPEHIPQITADYETGVVSTSTQGSLEEAVPAGADNLKPQRRVAAVLQPHQKVMLAQAIAGGFSISDCAKMLRRTPNYIKKIISEDTEYLQYQQHYEDLSLRAMVSHRFEMLKRSERAYEVLDSLLISADERMKLAAMDRVFDSVSPKPTKGDDGSGPLVELSFPGTDPEAHKALTEATLGIRELLEKVTEGALSAPPLDRHIRSSGDLPGPEDVVGFDNSSRGDDS